MEEYSTLPQAMLDVARTAPMEKPRLGHDNEQTVVALMFRCLAVQNSQSLVIASRKFILVERVHFHFATPKRPRSSNRALHRLPGIVGLFFAEIFQVALTLRLSRLDFSACLDINLALQCVAEVCIVDQHGCRLCLSSLLGIDRLVHCLFDSMCQRSEAMPLQQNNCMVWLKSCLGFGTRERVTNFGVDEAS